MSSKARAHRKMTLAFAVVAAMVLMVVALAACGGGGNASSDNTSDNSSTTTSTESTDNQATDQKIDQKEGTDTSAATPEEDEFGVVEAASWSSIYPEIYESFMLNEENSPEGKIDYVEEYPNIKILYKGNKFSEGYDEACGHPWSLDSVSNSPRITDATLANCITCKTPQFTALVNADGDSVYAQNFHETIGQFTESISCYNCHLNDPNSVVVTNKFWDTALGADKGEVSVNSEACGQCHDEYYFDPDSKAVMNPYDGLKSMTAEASLAYFDDIDFSDWTYEDTGAKMLKAQHPEFETIYGGDESHMASMGYTCADCHMATMTSEDGTVYQSHELVNPTDSPEIMEKCSQQGCHSDLAAQVKEWQDECISREVELSDKLVDYITALAAAKDSLSAEDLARAQEIQRDAQWYWDFTFVENSDGAHNPATSAGNLDKCEELLNQGMEIVGAGA